MGPDGAGDQADGHKADADLRSGNAEPIPTRVATAQIGDVREENKKESNERTPPTGHVEIKDALDQSHGAFGGRGEKGRIPREDQENGDAQGFKPVCARRFRGRERRGDRRCVGVRHHSSSRYSPKSHVTVKKMMSNAASRTVHVGDRNPGSSSKPEVASALAMSAGASSGSSSRGSNSSRMRACDEMAENAVPTVARASVPRTRTNKRRPRTGTRFKL